MMVVMAAIQPNLPPSPEQVTDAGGQSKQQQRAPVESPLSYHPL
jgi:hypothetical protein